MGTQKFTRTIPIDLNKRKKENDERLRRRIRARILMTGTILSGGGGGDPNAPTLDLLFAPENTGDAPIETLDSRITFSRGSHAMQYDSTGKLVYAPHNLAARTNGDTINASAGVTRTANYATAPDGSQTATLLTGLLAAAGDRTGYTVAIIPGSTITGSVYLKAPTADDVGKTITFGLKRSGGTLVATTLTVTLTAEWQRVSSTITALSDNTMMVLHLQKSGSDTADSVLYWGHQMEYGSVMRDFMSAPADAQNLNGPRFDHDPVTLEPRGLLIEEARTNLLQNSDGDISTYSVSNVTAAASPIAGFSNSLEFIDNTVLRYAYKTHPILTAGAAYALSIFVEMDDDAGPPNPIQSSTSGDFALIIEGSVAGITPSVTHVGGRRYRVTGVKSSAGGANQTAGIIRYTGQTNRKFKVTGYQLEAGSFATSYIPTTSSAATRAADYQLSVSDTSFWNATGGTMLFEGDLASVANSPRLWGYRADTNNRLITYMSTGGASNLFNMNGGVNDIALAVGPAPAANVAFKTVSTWALNDAAIATNGGVPATDTATTPFGGAAALYIGWEGSGPATNGHIKRIRYWNKRLPNEKLQELTA